MAELFELVLQTSYNGELCINRWNYVTNDIPAAVSQSFALVAAAGGIGEAPPANFPDGTMMEAIRLMVNDGVVFENVFARNIYSVTDYYDTPVPSGVWGAQTGSNRQSAYDAYGFSSNRTRLDIRRGYKRFVGVSEAAVGEYGDLTSGQIALMETVAELMSDPLIYDDESSLITFSPCIVKKEKYTTPSGGTAYRYYPLAQKATQLSLLSQPVVWTPYADKRTQDSRKR